MIQQAVLTGFFLMATTIFAGTTDDRELLRQYSGEVVLPLELYQTYRDLVTALEGGKQAEIEMFCLPDTIKFTTEPRVRYNREYGQDINLPFLKDGFYKHIQNLRKDSDTEYLIRTASTAFWFIKNKDGKWKLSKYMDKPIE